MNSPDVRARLVAQEVGIHSEHSFFAATRPLECNIMLLSAWDVRLYLGIDHDAMVANTAANVHERPNGWTTRERSGKP